VSGEASPDYLVSGLHGVVNILRFLPRAKLVVSNAGQEFGERKQQKKE